MADIPHITILGQKVALLTIMELHEQIEDHIDQGLRAQVLNVNVHAMNLAWKYPWFRQFLNSAEIVFCDGYGMQLAGRLLGHSIPERITYADWMWQLADYVERRGRSFYFLGGKPGIAEKAAEALKSKHPELNIAGVHHGYFDKTSGSVENFTVVEAINAANPDILLVAFGMPLQERWLLENWDRLNARIALTGGAALDYVSGTIRRGPRWMTDHGLEWLARLIIEPRRLWKRYLFGNPLFLWRVLKNRMRPGHL